MIGELLKITPGSHEIIQEPEKKNIRNGKKKNIRNGKRETPGTGSLKRKKAIKREPYDLRMMTDDMIRAGSRMTDIIRNENGTKKGRSDHEFSQKMQKLRQLDLHH